MVAVVVEGLEYLLHSFAVEVLPETNGLKVVFHEFASLIEVQVIVFIEVIKLPNIINGFKELFIEVLELRRVKFAIFLGILPFLAAILEENEQIVDLLG